MNSNGISEKTIALIQLERKQKEVEHLQSKLESFQYVPKTYNLFEKKETLKTVLCDLADSTTQLMATLKSLDITNRNYSNDIQQKFQEFNLVNQEVADYIKVVRF